MALQNYAVIENGKVTNVIVFDPEPKENWVRSDTARIGDSYDGKQFITPEAPVIQEPEPSRTDLILAAVVKKLGITEDDLKPAMQEEAVK